MIEPTQNQRHYEPDLVFPPGETLREVLTERGMTQAELAARMGRPKKTISEIASGKARLTDDTALELEAVLGIPSLLWSNLQHAYDRFQARQARQERLRQEAALLKDIPLKEMVRLGWVAKYGDKAAQLRAVFEFFAVSSLSAWESKYAKPVATFRASSKVKMGARAAWYRKAELELDALTPECPEYDPSAFEEALSEIRSFTMDVTHVGFRKAANLCRNAGVLLTVVRELPGAGVSGATIWRNKTPGVVLTLRFKSDDQLWFSFFHEAGHVLLHRGQLFLEVGAKNASEREADDFAAQQLIPPTAFVRLKRLGRYSKANVDAFAREQGICPGIVVGRLQHEKLLPPSHLNGLKRKLQWVE